MLSSSRPLSFPIPFAAGAGGSFIRTIPVNSQIGTQDGAASLTDGFPPDNFSQIAAGGVPPFGQDMNGILNQISAWCQWLEAGGPVGYDPAFAAAIGGYPAGAILNSNITYGAQWYSVVNNNTTNPDDPLTSVNWARVGLQPGMPCPILSTSAPGFVTANGTTVGSTSSGAAQTADAYLFVFKAIWDQFSNTQCPIFDSGGSASTRGANAVADFFTNKRLTTPNMKGLGVIGADTMGGTPSTFLNGVPVTTGNTTTPGSIVGENLHTLSQTEMPVHFHSAGIFDPTHSHTYSRSEFGQQKPASGGNPPFDNYSTQNTGASATGVRVNSTNGLDTTYSAGGGGAHNTAERNMVVYWGLKT